MKKYTYLLAIALLALSCNKEAEQNSPEVIPETNQGTDVIYAKITEEPVKTAYDADGKFTWVNTDQVIVLTQATGNANNQKCFTYSTSAGQISNEGKFASFTGSIESGYEKTSFAAYPITVKSDNTNSTYNMPFVKLPSSVPGTLSSTILIGIADGDDYMFNTGTSVFKITITNIPASAASVRLVSADKGNYPLDGDFTLVVADGVVTLDINHYHSEYKQYDKGYQSVDVSELGAVDSKDFYFNVPIGTYPADKLSIQILDAGNNIIFNKKIHKEITTVRNELLSLPTLNVDEYWTTLGTGKFIDNFLWAKIVAKGSVDVDTPTYVNVTVQQSATTPTKFRLVNPYGAAASQFGYTRPNSANADEYFEFTVAATTAGSAVTGYTTHRTGFSIDGSNYNPEIMYPTTYSAGSSTILNKVVAGDESLPKIIQFAPAYHYAGYEKTSSFTYLHYDKVGVMRVIFPNVSDYGGSLAVPAGINARLNNLRINKESNAVRIRGIVSKYTDYQIAAPGSAGSINNYPSDAKVTGANGSCDWTNTGLPAETNIPSGPVYLTWFTTNADSGNDVVYDQGRTKVYYINSSDYSAICKQHTSTGYKGHVQNEALEGSYTFEVSEEPLTSNVKMTEFDGMTPTMTSLSNSHQIFTSLDWIAPETTTYTGPDPVITNGSAQYGILSGSSILLNASEPFFKLGLVNVYVYSYTDYAGRGRGAANTPERFKFTITDGKVNLGETYINARFDGNNQASAPYANTVTEVTD